MLRFSRQLIRPINQVSEGRRHITGVDPVVIKALAPLAKPVADKVLELLKLLMNGDTALKNARVTTDFTKSPFIARPEIEGIIKSAMDAKVPGKKRYHVVFGAKGVGKTSLVHRMAEKREAAVGIKVGSADTMETISASFMKKITGKASVLDLEELREALKVYNEVTGITPIIIFDVERGDKPKSCDDNKAVMQQVRGVVKELHEWSNCYIIASEANAVFQFGMDDRERFVFVGEMTFDETKKFLDLRIEEDKLGISFTDAELHKIHDQIGGNPTVLNKMLDFLEKKDLLDKCLKRIVKEAHDELEGFKLQPILKAIKEHPEGVEPGYFKKQKYEGIDMSVPELVGDAMKAKNAIVFRSDLDPKVYQALSTKHKTALKTYEPIIYEELLFPRPAPPTPPQKPKQKLKRQRYKDK